MVKIKILWLRESVLLDIILIAPEFPEFRNVDKVCLDIIS